MPRYPSLERVTMGRHSKYCDAACKKAGQMQLAEMAFEYGIRDIRQFVVRVEKRRKGRLLKVVWEDS
jgi:hypothetical protein